MEDRQPEERLKRNQDSQQDTKRAIRIDIKICRFYND